MTGGRLLPRLVTAVLVVAGLWTAAAGPPLAGLVLLAIAGAAPLGRWIARQERRRAADGSDHRDPPAGFGGGGHGW